MQVSYNGWTASPDPDDIGIRTYTVPGTDVRVALRAATSPVLLYAASYWHAHIERIDLGQLDDWGYAFRNVRGGGALSNHASGTAIDINALKYPLGTRNMSAIKRAKVRALVARINKAGGKEILVWGGDWSRPDQMHLEMAPGTTIADVVRTMRKLRRRPKIYADKVIKAFERRIRLAPVSMSRVQKRLVTKGFLTGSYAVGFPGKKTRVAMAAWQKSAGFKPDGVPGRTQLVRLAGDVYKVV